MTPNQILLSAAKLLEDNGWCRHNYHRYNYALKRNEYCMVGALEEVSAVGAVGYDFEAERLARIKLSAYLFDHSPDLTSSSISLTDWNDKSSRTQEEVINTLRAAAEYTSTNLDT